MTERVIGINPASAGTGSHDPAAVIIEDGELVFGAEEERFNRRKHSLHTFPKQSIQSCLDFCGVELSEIDRVLVSWEPREKAKYDLRLVLDRSNLARIVYNLITTGKEYWTSLDEIRRKLNEIGSPIPPVEPCNHHQCHAASAFAPSGFDEALVVTLDGRGERDATVVWKGSPTGLERLRTYEYPNTLGGFYGSITAFLGYRVNNGEGKTMGLAPYGSYNREIAQKLHSLVDSGVEYDVSSLNYHTDESVPALEALFDRQKNPRGGDFDQWEQDLAHVAQDFIEETVSEIVETYSRREGLSNVCLAGGVALNCKMNKRVMELDTVDNIFVQPLANDAGSALGAGILGSDTWNTWEMSTVYFGPEYSTDDVAATLEEYKIPYGRPDDLEREVAERIADGELVGWFQGRLEMGPRALGNRSILADPRSIDSRDRVNEFVKHREEWRPFAPSMLESAVEDYLVDGEPAPYMIKTFDVKPDRRDKIPAVLHAADDTTRPQTVREDQNPRYYRLLREFERLTDVPVLLNTSFNDSGEPIVNTPTEAIKDFYGMGLDTLVLEDLLIEKSAKGVTKAMPESTA